MGLFNSGTKSTNNANMEIARLTNEANRAIANSTNAMNLKIQEGTNAANIQMNTENNDLQRELQNEMNEYNSIGAQLERAREAGVNPNAVVQGTINGNLQNTLPSTQAGRADSAHMEMGAPIQGATMENPYMEKMATINTLNQITNDYFNRQKTGAETENTRSTTRGLDIENRYKDDLNYLNIAIARGQAKQIEKTCNYIETQNETLKEQQNVFKANISLMEQQEQNLFTENYMKKESIDVFVKATKERLKNAGIPEDKWVSDDTIKAYYYQQLLDNDLTISQTQLNQIKGNETRANIGLVNATTRLTKANTKGKILENYLADKYGEDIINTDINNKNADSDNKRANTRKTVQDIKRDRYTESDQYQGYIIYGMALENAKTQSEVELNNANKKKAQAGAVREGIGAVNDAINVGGLIKRNLGN